MSEFDWPWEYNFSPFFTLQPHAKTREQQISVWSHLILKYQKHKNESYLNINEDTELFRNEAINRTLSLESRLIILDDLQKNGYASPVDKRRVQWEVYWHTLSEWAKIIYEWAAETGQAFSVCTLYEITNGDETQEFYKLDQGILLKILKCLEEQGKCEVILMDDTQGVKFF